MCQTTESKVSYNVKVFLSEYTGNPTPTPLISVKDNAVSNLAAIQRAVATIYDSEIFSGKDIAKLEARFQYQSSDVVDLYIWVTLSDTPAPPLFQLMSAYRQSSLRLISSTFVDPSDLDDHPTRIAFALDLAYNQPGSGIKEIRAIGIDLMQLLGVTSNDPNEKHLNIYIWP